MRTSELKNNNGTVNFNLNKFGIFFNQSNVWDIKKFDDDFTFFSKYKDLKSRYVNNVDNDSHSSKLNKELLGSNDSNSSYSTVQSENGKIFNSNSFEINVSSINYAFIDNSLKFNYSKSPKIKNNLNFHPELVNKINSLELVNDQKFKIDLEYIFFKKDHRTTLMIRNIPSTYNLHMLLFEINLDFRLKYDVVYLPVDYSINLSIGYAFINFVDPMHIILFHEKFYRKSWLFVNSNKICDLTYANYQGKEEIIKHFKKGKVLKMDDELKRPLILPTPFPLPKVELPIRFKDYLLGIYPNSSIRIKDLNTFIVDYYFS